MEEITKAEEEVLQVLWDLEYAFIKDIIAELPEPKPAYNTISTFVRSLQQKGYVGHETHGKSHKYYPLLPKEEYTRTHMTRLVKNYFQGSYKQMVSFFARDQKLSIKELEQLINELKKDKK